MIGARWDLILDDVTLDPHNRPKLIWKRDPDIDIFDFKLDEGKIIDALQKIKFKELKGRRFWFVVHRVFEELKWLTVTMDNKFACWVGLYFQWPWDTKKPWRTVEKDIRDAASWKWDKDSAYAKLARLLWTAFTDKPKRSENEVPVDKDYFYLPNIFFSFFIFPFMVFYLFDNNSIK